MWCSSARNSLAIASAIEVLPTPGGPTKSQAELNGCATSLPITLRGFSNPTNSLIVCGLYFSASDCGEAIAARFGCEITDCVSVTSVDMRFLSGPDCALSASREQGR